MANSQRKEPRLPVRSSDFGLWHPQLVCFVHNLAVDFQSRVAKLTLPRETLPDMQAVIRVVGMIDGRVERIEVVSGESLIETYSLKNGSWRCARSNHHPLYRRKNRDQDYAEEHYPEIFEPDYPGAPE